MAHAPNSGKSSSTRFIDMEKDMKRILLCLEDLVSDLEGIALVGYPESGGWNKISKDCQRARIIINEIKKNV
jgi:hypothetical protein